MTLTDNVLAVFDRASDAEREEGTAWYPLASRIVTAIAEATDTDVVRVTYTLAALSPRNPWLWNVADCYSYALASREGSPRPTATTFERNRQAAWRAMSQDGHPWVDAAPKVKAFVAAILGDSEAVVVDIWAYRVAVGHEPTNHGKFRASQYEPIAEAYRNAARRRGVTPRTMQAVTWLVAQSEGLASRRKGRHDLVFKRDTPAFVRTLLA
jgi:hypothetical protein